MIVVLATMTFMIGIGYIQWMSVVKPSCTFGSFNYMTIVHSVDFRSCVGFKSAYFTFSPVLCQSHFVLQMFRASVETFKELYMPIAHSSYIVLFSTG